MRIRYELYMYFHTCLIQVARKVFNESVWPVAKSRPGDFVTLD